MIGQFLFKQVFDLLFPIFCIGCNSYGKTLCDTCLSQLSFSPAWIDIGNLKVWSAFSYSKKLHGKIIQQWKYHGDRQLLIDLVSKFKLPKLESDYIIVPVPLHRKRMVERGFNQARQLAEVISEHTNLNIGHLIKRTRYTKQQAKLNKTQRTKNVENSFILKPGVSIPKKVILVDDVVTTGATISECFKILNEAGVTEVLGITLFRKELNEK